MVECRRWRRMLWSTVSNAELRSRRIKRDGEPVSAFISRSFVTRTKADSVLWPERKPDWNFSNSLFCFKWTRSCAATTFSSTLERNGSLEMGLYLSKTSGSKVDFLRRGLMTAVVTDTHFYKASKWSTLYNLCWKICCMQSSTCLLSSD